MSQRERSWFETQLTEGFDRAANELASDGSQLTIQEADTVNEVIKELLQRPPTSNLPQTAPLQMLAVGDPLSEPGRLEQEIAGARTDRDRLFGSWTCSQRLSRQRTPFVTHSVFALMNG